MRSKEEFKSFVRKHDEFINEVKEKRHTWQDLYELWDMYGDDDKVFSKYKTYTTNDLNNVITSIKNINMDNVKRSLNGIEKGIKLLQDFVKKEDIETSYEPRPLFKKFED